MPDFTRLDAVKARRPLVHCISNIVTANDCANLALAVGASPMMAQAPEEMAEIAAISAAAVLNTGTPSEEKFRACLLCGKEAVRLGHPVVLDPVGVGASPWRLQWVKKLLEQFTPTILRVNLGEAQALYAGDSREQGVDSLAAATQTQRLEAAVNLAQQYGTVVLLSGPEDIATDGRTAWLISGGSPRMSQITGAGCMLSVLCGVFAAVEPEALEAAVLAAGLWKVCSQRAHQAAENRGPGSFRTALIDAAGMLMATDFSAEARLCRIM